jgi:hypothetical protein
MEKTLLLNITYEPLQVISWQKAITLLTLGKVEVVEEYDREVHSVSFSSNSRRWCDYCNS